MAAIFQCIKLIISKSRDHDSQTYSNTGMLSFHSWKHPKLKPTARWPVYFMNLRHEILTSATQTQTHTHKHFQICHIQVYYEEANKRFEIQSKQNTSHHKTSTCQKSMTMDNKNNVMLMFIICGLLQ
jgi:hypothetical protein